MNAQRVQKRFSGAPRRWTPGLLGLALAAALVAGIAAAPRAQDAEEATDQVEEELEITSDNMTMDFANKIAVFEGAVRVNDARMTLFADKMAVTLSEQDELKHIEATGNVVIRQASTDRRAMAGRAMYDVDKGTIVLTEKPSVIVGENSVTEAQKITYHRDTERFEFGGGRPTIRIKRAKQKGSVLPKLFGRDRKDADKPEAKENDE